PALVVIQTEFFLHLLVALFHRPAAPPQADGFEPAGARRQVAEGVLELAVGLLLDQKPDRLGPGALPRGPPPARPDPRPGEPAPHRPLGPLPPRHLPPRRACRQPLEADRPR